MRCSSIVLFIHLVVFERYSFAFLFNVKAVFAKAEYRAVALERVGADVDYLAAAYFFAVASYLFFVLAVEPDYRTCFAAVACTDELINLKS